MDNSDRKKKAYWRVDTKDVMRQIGEDDGLGIIVFKSNLPLIEWTKQVIKDGMGLDFEIDEKSHPTKVIFKIKY